MATRLQDHRPEIPAVPGQKVSDPADWTRAEIESSDAWLYRLDADDVAELDQVVAALDESGIEIRDIGRHSFRLDGLGAKLAAVKQDVLWGRGFALVRGVPVERYSRRQAAIAFWCLGLQVGDPVSQNAKGHLLGHVQDLGGRSLSNPANRGYETRETLPFHSDFADVVVLLCLHPARSGGKSLIASSVAIHNEMLKRRPDLAAALAEPLYRDRRGEIPDGKDPWYRVPVFNYYQGYLTSFWTPSYIRSAARFEELPKMPPALIEALDLFDALAAELAVSVEFRAGDVQILHNHTVVHSRTEFEDWPEPERKRHLLRLLLSTPDGRPLPPMWGEQYAHLKPGERPAAGIVVPGAEFRTPLEAE